MDGSELNALSLSRFAEELNIAAPKIVKPGVVPYRLTHRFPPPQPTISLSSPHDFPRF